jgi:hypothetical protein
MMMMMMMMMSSWGMQCQVGSALASCVHSFHFDCRPQLGLWPLYSVFVKRGLIHYKIVLRSC